MNGGSLRLCTGGHALTCTTSAGTSGNKTRTLLILHRVFRSPPTRSTSHTNKPTPHVLLSLFLSYYTCLLFQYPQLYSFIISIMSPTEVGGYNEAEASAILAPISASHPFLRVVVLINSISCLDANMPVW